MTRTSTPRISILNTVFLLSPFLGFAAGVALNHWSTKQPKSESTAIVEAIFANAEKEEVALRHEIESLREKARLDFERIKQLEELNAAKSKNYGVR